MSYLVLAPEHPLVLELVSGTDYEADVLAFIEKMKGLNEIARTSTDAEKEGLFIGAHCLNPLSGKKVPIWIANYVLLEYGTGAVMGVPAHDERDFEFAGKYSLEIKTVIVPPGSSPEAKDQPLKAAFTGKGLWLIPMLSMDSAVMRLWNGLPMRQSAWVLVSGRLISVCVIG